MAHIYLSFKQLLFSGFISLVATFSVSAQSSFANLYAANARISTIAVSGNITYIGGEFTYVGPNTGAGVALDMSTGEFDTAIPAVKGQIFSVVTAQEDGTL